jgi:hypothetical protein
VLEISKKTMDQKELQEQIALYYSKLPKEAQESFSSMKWLETVRQIAIKYELNEGQISTLGTETTLVLLGIIHEAEYEAVLKNELRLAPETFSKIFSDISEKVLLEVRSQITEAYVQNITERTPEQIQVEEKLSENFKKFPKSVQDAIDKADYQQTLYDISQEEDLSISQLGLLEEITTKVILGDLSGQQFAASVRNGLGITEEKASFITQKINEAVLKKIRSFMMAPAAKSSDTEVLGQAGIKIVTKGVDNVFRSNIITPQKTIAPTIAQKLSQPVQMPKVKTEYSLNNVSKSNSLADLEKTKELSAPSMADVKPVQQNSVNKYTKGGDPYRLSPDE